MWNQKFKLDFSSQEKYFFNIFFNICPENKMYSSDITETYLETCPKLYRKTLGQFFTPNDIKNVCLKLTKPCYSRILEPSFGTGEFLTVLNKEFPSSSITGCEIDEKLFTVVKEKFERENMNLYNSDFLLQTFPKKFHLIMGNPPYFELYKLDKLVYEKYRELYGNIIQGRSNIYALFLKKCVDILKNNGDLIFVIPNSLKNSPSFEKLREYIFKKCNVLCCIDMDIFDSNVQQTVQIVHLKRVRNPSIKFTETVKKTIETLPIKITTGPIVWNKQVDKLTDNGTFLIYSGNITENGEIVEIKMTGKRKQFIDALPMELPALVVSRTYSRKTGIKCCLIQEGKYIAENHVNVITGSLEILKVIEENLRSKNTHKYLLENTGTVNLSKSEILKIPLEILKKSS